jgi:hypothetical protein
MAALSCWRSFEWGIAARILLLLTPCASVENSSTSQIYQNATASPWMNLSFLTAQKVPLCTFLQEDPTLTDFQMCKEAVLRLCSGTPYPLFQGGMSVLPIPLVNGLRQRTTCNYTGLAMIPPALPSAPTMSCKGVGPPTEASMTGHLMNRGYTQGHTMPTCSCWELRVQLCTPKHQFVSPSRHLQLFGKGWTPMAIAVCGRTSPMTVTESGFGMDYSANLEVSHTMGHTRRKNHPTYVWRRESFSAQAHNSG